MKSIEVNGKTIKTNYGESSMFNLHSGNPGKTQTLYVERDGETNDEFFRRMVDLGYKTIRFATYATNVSGWHKMIALCRR